MALRNEEIKLKAVTTHNSPCEGGRSRQKIISEIYRSTGAHIVVDLDYTSTASGHASISVRDTITGQQIGNVYGEEAEELAGIKPRIRSCMAKICYDGKWWVYIYNTKVNLFALLQAKMRAHIYAKRKAA